MQAGFWRGAGELSGPGAQNTLTSNTPSEAGSSTGVTVGTLLPSPPTPPPPHAPAGAGDETSAPTSRRAATAPPPETDPTGRRKVAGQSSLPRWGATPAQARVVLTAVLVVVFGTLTQPLFLALSGGTSLPTWDVEAGVSKADTVLAAGRFAAKLGLPGDGFLASESNGARLVALPQLDLHAEAVHTALALAKAFDSSATLVTLNEMWASPIAPACAAVTTLLERMASRPAPRFDQLGPANQDRGPPPRDAMQDWATTLTWITSVDGQLHEALTQAAVTNPRGSFLIECAERITAPGRPLAEGVPVELRGAGDPVLDRALDALPFSRRYRPTITAWIPAPGPQALSRSSPFPSTRS